MADVIGRPVGRGLKSPLLEKIVSTLGTNEAIRVGKNLDPSDVSRQRSRFHLLAKKQPFIIKTRVIEGEFIAWAEERNT